MTLFWLLALMSTSLFCLEAEVLRSKCRSVQHTTGGWHAEDKWTNKQTHLLISISCDSSFWWHFSIILIFGIHTHTFRVFILAPVKHYLLLTDYKHTKVLPLCFVLSRMYNLSDTTQSHAVTRMLGACLHLFASCISIDLLLFSLFAVGVAM